jgi:hypothetical protein
MSDHSQLVKTLRIRGGKMNIASADAIDALQARVAELEALVQRISDEGRIKSGGIRRPAKYIQIPADLFSIARALLERKPS